MQVKQIGRDQRVGMWTQQQRSGAGVLRAELDAVDQSVLRAVKRSLLYTLMAALLALLLPAGVYAMPATPTTPTTQDTATKPIAPIDCFEASAQQYRLSADLLRGIARAESDMQPHAVNRSHLARTGTTDVGLMQINTGWLPTLAKHGITEANLFEPCTNVAVGAWIMAQLVAKHGDHWQAVGAYNAACTTLKGAACLKARSTYAWRVFRRLDRKPVAAVAASHAVGLPPVSVGLVSIAALVEPGESATVAATATATVMAPPSQGDGL